MPSFPIIVDRPQIVVVTPARKMCTSIRTSNEYLGYRRLQRESLFGAELSISSFFSTLESALLLTALVAMQKISRLKRILSSDLHHRHGTGNGVHVDHSHRTRH
jgi:hypothetical protein